MTVLNETKHLWFKEKRKILKMIGRIEYSSFHTENTLSEPRLLFLTNSAIGTIYLDVCVLISEFATNSSGDINILKLEI